MKFKSLEWSEIEPPNREIGYDHAIAKTPFGRFVITWKGWKEYDSPTIDETPWGGFGGVGCDLNDAKLMAENEYIERINNCLDNKE